MTQYLFWTSGKSLDIAVMASAFICKRENKCTVMAKNIGTLGKYDQRTLWNKSTLLILFIFFLSQKSNLSLDNNKFKWGEISL